MIRQPKKYKKIEENERKKKTKKMKDLIRKVRLSLQIIKL